MMMAKLINESLTTVTVGVAMKIPSIPSRQKDLFDDGLLKPCPDHGRCLSPHYTSVNLHLSDA